MNGIALRCMVVLGLASAQVLANVSVQTGNFYIGYTDVVFPGGFEPKIERVYNSKTSFTGMFGYGWGCELEVYVEAAPDGFIIVHEYGGGADNLFHPAEIPAAQIQRVIDIIIDAAIRNHDITNREERTKLEEGLRTDERSRYNQWHTYVTAGLVENADVLPLGAVLTSDRFGHQTITRTENGYLRSFDNGRVEHFNDSGKLVRVSDSNGNSIKLSYDLLNHLSQLSDNFGRRIDIFSNSSGLVERVVERERGRSALYRYNDAGDLIYSKDVDGNEYTYAYDAIHNLTKIGYSDKTTMEMAYAGQESDFKIKLVKDRDGTVTEYKYVDLTSPDHLKVQITVQDAEHKPVSSSFYEYFWRSSNSGEKWTWKMITDLNGDKTETEYAEGSRLPLVITQNGEKTTFTYDPAGHVIRKETPTEVTELSYDNRVSKVKEVRKFEPNKPESLQWSRFQYDLRGNLLYAESSQGRSVKLDYDNHGRIAGLIDQTGQRIHFEYNRNSKPIEIHLIKAGAPDESMLVTYTDDGEIKKVESPKGRTVALQVTSAFQELSELIRSANVDLSF